MGASACRCWNPIPCMRRSEANRQAQVSSNSNPNVPAESDPLLTDHQENIVSTESRDGPSNPINLIRKMKFLTNSGNLNL